MVPNQRRNHFMPSSGRGTFFQSLYPASAFRPFSEHLLGYVTARLAQMEQITLMTGSFYSVISMDYYVVSSLLEK